MRKDIRGIYSILILGCALLIYAGSFNHKVCFNGYCFNVELAVTEPEREKGLMLRDNLSRDRGMLFVYKDEGIYPFWMKNTRIPLDMIWINSRHQAVFIKEDASPCGENKCTPVYPGGMARYVLEINSGSVKKIGLKAGDRLSFYNIN